MGPRTSTFVLCASYVATSPKGAEATSEFDGARTKGGRGDLTVKFLRRRQIPAFDNLTRGPEVRQNLTHYPTRDRTDRAPRARVGHGGVRVQKKPRRPAPRPGFLVGVIA